MKRLLNRKCADCQTPIAAWGGRLRCVKCARIRKLSCDVAYGKGNFAPHLEGALQTDRAQRQDAAAQDLFDRSESKTIDDMLNAGAALEESMGPLEAVRQFKFSLHRREPGKK